MADAQARPWAPIAARLRAIREIYEMNQRTFANGAGLNHKQYANWESGNYRISVDGARALRSKYGPTLDFIYDGIEDALPMNIRKALSERPRLK